MYKENNQAIPYLSDQMVQYDKKENWQFKVSLAIIAFLMTSIIGYVYYSLSIQHNIDKVAVLDTVDYTIDNATEQLSEKARNLSYVQTVGSRKDIGYIGSMQLENSNYSDSESIEYFSVGYRLLKKSQYFKSIPISYADPVHWQKQILPNIINMKGSYPDQANEIMMPTLTLTNLGIEKPQIGMKIPLEILDDAESMDHTMMKKEFVLSGYFDEKSLSMIPAIPILCSETFYNQNRKLFSASTIYLTTIGKNTHQRTEQLQKDLGISAVNITDTWSYKNGLLFFELSEIALWKLTPFLLFLLYLTLKNIFSLSIYKHMHIYLNYQSLGMTEKQIKNLVKRNFRSQCLIPVLEGIGIGFVVSAILVFVRMRYTLIHDFLNQEKWFHLLIDIWPLLLAIVFAAGLVHLSMYSSFSTLNRILSGKMIKNIYDVWYKYLVTKQIHTSRNMVNTIATKYFDINYPNMMSRSFIASIGGIMCICSAYWYLCDSTTNSMFFNILVMDPLYIGIFGLFFILINILSEINLNAILYQMRSRDLAVLEAAGMIQTDIEKIIRKEGQMNGKLTILLTITLGYIMMVLTDAFIHGQANMDTLDNNAWIKLGLTVVMVLIVYRMIYTHLPIGVYRLTRNQGSLSQKIRVIAK